MVLSCQVFDVENNKYESGFAHRRNATLQSLKEAAERKRLLYVAATRAQDYLLISGQVSLNKDGLWSSRGWLQQLLSAFGLEEIKRMAEQTCAFSGGNISVLMPSAPPPPDVLYQSANIAEDLWDFEADEDEYPPYAPPLIQPLLRQDPQFLSHITATQIAQLGEYRRGLNQQQRQAAARRFRESALHGLPSETKALNLQQQADTPKLIGEIVHELLRYGSFAPEKQSSDAMISSIAWEKGLNQSPISCASPVAKQTSCWRNTRLAKSTVGSLAHVAESRKRCSLNCPSCSAPKNA